MSDIKLFERYGQHPGPTEGKITDFFDIKIDPEFVPWAAHLSGSVNMHMPIPDDGIKAEAIEYFALLNSSFCRSSASGSAI